MQDIKVREFHGVFVAQVHGLPVRGFSTFSDFERLVEPCNPRHFSGSGKGRAVEDGGVKKFTGKASVVTGAGAGTALERVPPRADSSGIHAASAAVEVQP